MKKDNDGQDDKKVTEATIKNDDKNGELEKAEEKNTIEKKETEKTQGDEKESQNTQWFLD